MTISIIFCFIVAVVLAMCIVFLLLEYKRLKKSYDALQESYRNLEDLNSEM